MNDFSNEMNEIYKLAGVQLNEGQGYFTDWNSIKERVIERYIDARLEETGVLYNDEYYIQEWLEQNASADMLEELYEESGETEINWVANYINKNADEGGIVSKVANDMISEYFDDIAKQIQGEFEQNNLIYRMIDSDKSPKEIAQILKTNGTGNCWAKQEENAKAYYGNGNYNEYCLIGEATIDNVNWETTIFLRMMAEEENEVRLRKDSPIHIVGIKYYHYNEDNKLDKKDHMKVDMTLSVGHSYIFNESEQVNESIAFVSKKDLSDIILKNPTKRELRENNLTLCRCIEDSEGNWYFADMENMLHAYIVSELRDEASFPLFDGNDCYGIAYYDAESNEFWYNLNDYMYRKECIEQYNNSEYLRTTFPNARVIPNPWNNQMYDELYDDDEDNNQINESIRKLEIQNSPMIYEVTSLNNIKALLHRCRFGLRGIMNNSTGHLFVCDNEELIHHNLMKIINKNIEPVDSYSKLSFYNNKEKALDSEYVYEDVWGYGWDLYTDNEIYVWVCNHDLSGDAYNLVSNLEMVYPPEDEDGYIDVQQLNEEIIHAEKSNYDDYMAVVLKNPTKKELRDNELEHSRFICYEDGTWLFFDSMQWIHEQILSKYRYGRCNGTGFYDLRSNEFIFMESMNYDEDEEGYEEEVAYYEDKCKKWLLTKPYIRENFGLNPRVTIYGDWVDSPW